MTATPSNHERGPDSRRSDGSHDRRGDEDMDPEGTARREAFHTYTDNEYGYQLTYPADWIVETESSGGATFDDRTNSAGATVSVDEDIQVTLAEYVAGFLADLTDDKHVRAMECLNRRDIALESGEIGRAIDYAYLSVPRGERWRFTYLFVLDGATGYILGVDWNDDDTLDDLAARIVESFAVKTS